jgi:hypothetical protein
LATCGPIVNRSIRAQPGRVLDSVDAARMSAYATKARSFGAAIIRIA